MDLQRMSRRAVVRTLGADGLALSLPLLAACGGTAATGTVTTAAGSIAASSSYFSVVQKFANQAFAGTLTPQDALAQAAAQAQRDLDTALQKWAVASNGRYSEPERELT